MNVPCESILSSFLSFLFDEFLIPLLSVLLFGAAVVFCYIVPLRWRSRKFLQGNRTGLSAIL